jgi:hypothetical protein
MEEENLLRLKILEKEVETLIYFAERHERWAKSCDAEVMANQFRMIAELLKDVIEDDQTLIEWLKTN